jgi:cobalamin biosynthesis Co2+ chelatase CbiK
MNNDRYIIYSGVLDIDKIKETLNKLSSKEELEKEKESTIKYLEETTTRIINNSSQDIKNVGCTLIGEVCSNTIHTIIDGNFDSCLAETYCKVHNYSNRPDPIIYDPPILNRKDSYKSHGFAANVKHNWKRRK